MFFEVAGITVPLWLPPLAGFVLAFFSSMVGISGALLRSWSFLSRRVALN